MKRDNAAPGASKPIQPVRTGGKWKHREKLHFVIEECGTRRAPIGIRLKNAEYGEYRTDHADERKGRKVYEDSTSLG